MSVPSLIGRKVGMTSVFDAAGAMVGVTVLEVGPNRVVYTRTSERHGYDAVALGYGARKASRSRKPDLGQVKAAGLDAVPAVVREVRLAGAAGVKAGDTVGVADVFEVGAFVDVVGTSRGFGFQGVHKRHHFNLGPATHGSKFRREPGSTGMNTFPARRLPGKRMPGHMGNVRRTIRNLRVVAVDPGRNYLLVAGPVPGSDTGVVMVRRAVAKRTPKTGVAKKG